MLSFVISCSDVAGPRWLPGTQRFPCVRVTRERVGSQPVGWRARAVLDGNLKTLDISDLPSPGAVGCALSHIALWKRLAESDAPAFVIFEDDADLTASPEAIEAVAHAALARGDVDVLLLGYRFPLDTLLARRTSPLDDTLALLEAPKFYETHAYVITARAARVLLREALPVEMQIDAYMGAQRLRHGLRFAVPRLGAMARQSRAIWDSSVQAALMEQCAICRLPPAWRSGWATLGLVVVLLVLVACAVRR